MLTVQEEVDSKLEQWHPRLRKGRGLQSSTTGGFTEGMEAGQRINLAKQIGG
jgi:hypothetical protein